jgi:hypothetical protein
LTDSFDNLVKYTSQLYSFLSLKRIWLYAKLIDLIWEF